MLERERGCGDIDGLIAEVLDAVALSRDIIVKDIN
jgi:hypothetical protein